jgi:hypothetical protein
MISDTPVRVCGSDRFAEIGELRALEDNPRSLTQEAGAKLDESLLSLGLFRPLLVWRDPTSSGFSVIGGNQRFARLRSLVEQGAILVLDDGSPAPGIPVTVFEGSEERARLVALRDNNSDGEWEWTALAEYTSDLSERLAALGDESLDLGLAGFDSIVLEDLAVYAGAISSDVDDEAPEVFADFVEPEPQDDPTAERERLLSDPNLREVKVAIGHVRGRLSAATYERLVSALAIEGDGKGEGLDAAFSALLDRVV